MNLIAAVDRNWAIGRDGRLLVSIPSDKETFRRETVGKAVIMGRKTLESLPGGQPLAKRTNVVLSRDPDFRMKGAVVCGSVEEALEAVSGFAPEDVFVIGGQETYEAFLPYCDTAYITYIDYKYQADAYLHDLDRDPDWEVTADSEEQTYFDIPYRFLPYQRKR